MIFVLVLTFLTGCSLISRKERIVYETVRVPVPMESIKYIYRPHECKMPEMRPILKWAEYKILYEDLYSAFYICLDSLKPK